jgi:hypothetical protein
MADFRIKGPFSAIDTEVLLLARWQTSVSKAHFPRLIRKFYTSQDGRLPCQRPVFRDWYGSFTPRKMADFRVKDPFSVIDTEVDPLGAPFSMELAPGQV